MDTKSQETERKSGVTMVVFSGDLDKILAAFIIANGAMAMDMEVHMFFTFWGVNVLRKDRPAALADKKSLVEKMFGWMMPRGSRKLKLSNMNMGGMGTFILKKEMAKKNVMSLENLIDSAQALGVKLTICEMSMNIMGIRKEELIDGVDFGGVATFLDSADRYNTTLFI